MCRDDLASAHVEDYAKAQIEMICNNEAAKGSVVRVMPDVHPGKIGPIGLTMTIGDRILPGLVGIDIGCGMTAVQLSKVRKDYQRLDIVIRDFVPSGFHIRSEASALAESFDFDRLLCARHIQLDKARNSIGTLGSGNHFIELDEDNEGNVYLIVHTGSRYLGKAVAEYYMSLGAQRLKEQGVDVPYEMTYLERDYKEAYLHDLWVVQEYASLNREVILREITRRMKWKIQASRECIHNYVDQSGETPILRKGAISAKMGEPVIIPINMRDGVILGRGLGNPEWNASAPHGSGRILPREEVRKTHTVSEFKKEMKNVYSSSIGAGTLDEAPFAYRDLEYIREAIRDTVTIESVLKPVYNYKAGSEVR